MATVLLSVYALTLAGLLFFALHRLKILWLYARHCRGETPLVPAWEGRLPLVCLQCPVYNEPLVIAGLLVGAAYFQRQGTLLSAAVLLIEGIGFLGVAALSTRDLLCWR
jgi:hypothetical protein